MNEPTTNRPTTSGPATSATSTLAEVQRLRAEVARLAGELTPTVSEAARMSYLQRVGQLRMAELAAGEIVRSQNPPSRESVAEDLALEVLEAPQLPDDPAHPLNDPARLEAMSTEEYLALLEQWHQSPQYQQAESAAAGWRDRL